MSDALLRIENVTKKYGKTCLLYTSDAADD